MNSEGNNLDFNNKFLMKFKDKCLEDEFIKERERKLLKYNPYLTASCLIISCIDMIFQICNWQEMQNFNLNWAKTNIYISFIVSSLSLIFLISVFCIKNKKIQITINWINYLIITFPFFHLRNILLNLKKVDSSVCDMIMNFEYFIRITWVFLLMILFHEMLILNIVILITLLLYLPLLTGKFTLNELNLNYMISMIFLIFLCYIYSKQERTNYYLNDLIKKNDKCFLSILDQMNSGYMHIKKGKIRYVNKILFDNICKNNKINTIFDSITKENFVLSLKEDFTKIYTTTNLTKQNEKISYNEFINLINKNEKVSSSIINFILDDLILEDESSNNLKLIKNKEEILLKKDDKLTINQIKNETNLNMKDNSFFLANYFRKLSLTPNKYFDRIKSISSNEALNKNFFLLGNKQIEREVIQNSESNKEILFFQVFCRYEENANGEDYKFIFNDISKAKEIEEKNSEFKYKSLFLSKIAHEFKNPLICISELIDQTNERLDNKRNNQNFNLNLNNSLSNLIKNQANQLNIKTESSKSLPIILDKTLPLIKSLSNYLLILVKDLDFFSQTEIGKSCTLLMADTDLDEVIDFCREITKGLLKKNDQSTLVDLVFNKGKRVPKYICIDETKLKQVLINLLSNSVKFTRRGSIRLEISIIINENNSNLNDDKKFLNFEIIDTGSGIPAELQKNLFKPFIKGFEKSNKNGAGLGLSIVSDIINKMKGKIDYKSNSNGTIFSVHLPYKNSSICDSSSLILKKNSEILYYSNKSELSLCSSATLELSNLVFNKANFNNNFGTASYNPLYKKSLFHSSKTANNCSNISSEINSYSNEKYFNREIKKEDLNFSICNVIEYPNKYEFQYSDNTFLNIIIADDEPLARKSTIRILEKVALEINRKINILESEDGLETLYILFKNINNGIRLDGILTDENMKFMNGTDTSKILKNIVEKNGNFNVPIFLLSAYEDKKCIDGIEYFQEIFSKPLNKNSAEKILKLNYL